MIMFSTMWSIRYTKNKEKERNNMFKIKKLFNWIFAKPKEESRQPYQQPRGFLDFETGRRIEIDPKTQKEYFV